jgi:predicted enzyme related to lactoylglutathione lyase
MNATATKVHGIDATYYTVKDLDRATAFYTTLLGAAPNIQVPDMISEWTLGDDNSFGLYKPPAGEGEFHPSGGVMFVVDDVAAAVSAHKVAGVTFHGDIEDTPMCHMAFGQDSEGNGFILHKRK